MRLRLALLRDRQGICAIVVHAFNTTEFIIAQPNPTIVLLDKFTTRIAWTSFLE